MVSLKGIGLAAAFGLCAATAQAQAAGDWAHFGGTLGDTKYSALDQINAGTINRLKVVWRAPALDPALRAENPTLVPSNNFRNAPLVVDGVMYISNQIGLVEARDPGSGRIIWRHAPFPGDPRLTPAAASRALALWGKGAAGSICAKRPRRYFRGRHRRRSWCGM